MAEQPGEPEHLSLESPDPLAERAQVLRDLVPEAFAEGKLDPEKLREALGDLVENGPERYSFTWAGKRDAIRLLQVSSQGALVPCPEESIDFDTTSNIFIEGENLEVLKLLYRAYFGRVKMIYIDPPYNTGNDFIYPDNFADSLDTYLRLTGQTDGGGNHLTSNPETSGRYHSAWLSMMYPRLFLARQLLQEDGVIFVSIDDHEVHNLRLVMNEVFGEENFLAQVVVQMNPRGRHLDRFVARTHEYVLIYARDASCQPLYRLEKDERLAGQYNKRDKRGQYRELELRNRNPAFNSRTRPNLYFPLFVDPKSGSVSLVRDQHHTVEVYPKNSLGGDSCWTWSKNKVRANATLLTARSASTGGWRVFRKDYLVRDDGTTATTLPKGLWLDKDITNDFGREAVQDLFQGKTVFDFPKSPKLLSRLLELGSRDGDIVVDFFSGSSTTAEAVLGLNARAKQSRAFVLVQLPEPTLEGSVAREAGFFDIAGVGKERIRLVIAKIKAERLGQFDLFHREATGDLGFRVFKLSPSSFKPWPASPNGDANAYAEQMAMFKDPLTEEWTPERVIYEVALKEGFGLNCRVEPVSKVRSGTVHRVIDPDQEQAFYICLDDCLDLEALRPLELGKEDLFICRDVALSDEAAGNLALQCRLKTI